ncbi:MAG: hypothetical protein AAFU33_01840 [Bacteroidota bacterium]
MHDKWKILFLASNPKDLERKQFDSQLREVKEAIRGARYRDRLPLEHHMSVRKRDVYRTLLEEMPRIIHFCGNGEKGKGFILEDENGKAQSVAPHALAKLINECAKTVEVIIINASFSGAHARVLKAHIPHIIAMPDKVTDGVAKAFAGAFYDALGVGRSVKASFDAAVAYLGVIYAQLEHPPQYFQGRLPQQPTVIPPAVRPSAPSVSLPVGMVPYKKINREDQLDKMGELLGLPCHQPKVALIHGAEADQPDILIEHFVHKYFKGQCVWVYDRKDPGRLSMETISKNLTDYELLKRNISKYFGYEVGVFQTGEELLDARSHQKTLILPLKIEGWGKGTEALLKQFITDFWGKNIPADREVYIFINVCYPTKEERSFFGLGRGGHGKIFRSLEKFWTEFQGHSRLVPKLETITKDKVASFFANDAWFTRVVEDELNNEYPEELTMYQVVRLYNRNKAS